MGLMRLVGFFGNATTFGMLALCQHGCRAYILFRAEIIPMSVKVTRAFLTQRFAAPQIIL